MLAEEEAATVRAERTRDADTQLEEARRIVSDAGAHRDRTCARRRAGRRDRVDGARRGGAHHRHRPPKANKLEGESQARLTELERQRNQVTSQLGALRDQVTQQLSALRNQLAPRPRRSSCPAWTRPPRRSDRRPRPVPASSSRLLDGGWSSRQPAGSVRRA